MMVWMGVYSQTFLPPVGKVTARVLDQTQVNVPFRVQAPARRGGRQCPLASASAADMIRFLPEIILTVAGTLLMVLDPLLHRRSSNVFGHLSLLALLRRHGRLDLRLQQPGRPSAACWWWTASPRSSACW